MENKNFSGNHCQKNFWGDLISVDQYSESDIYDYSGNIALVGLNRELGESGF